MRLFVLTLLFCGLADAKEIITLANAKKVVQTPQGCVETGAVCAFKTSSDEKFKFKMSENQVVLDENTAVVQRSGTHLTLVSGQIWIHAKSEIKVETPYGSTTAFDGDFLIRNMDKRMDVKAIEGDAMLSPKALNKNLKLEAGEQNWIGEVDETNTASTGVPVPIRPSELVVNWARLYVGTKVEFERDFKNFFEAWSKASENLAKFHSSLATREVANEDAEKARLLELKKQKDKEHKRIKEWFRRRELAD